MAGRQCKEQDPSSSAVSGTEWYRMAYWHMPHWAAIAAMLLSAALLPLVDARVLVT